MKFRILVACFAFIALVGCQFWNARSVPEELLGTWATSARKYAESSLEFTDESIIFKSGPKYVDVNDIAKIEKVPEEGRTLYNVFYEGAEGGKCKLSLYRYDRGEKQGIIRFKNQREVYWTKKKGTRPKG